MTFVVEALRRDHARQTFASGEPALDRYFREAVTQDVRRRMAICYVAVAQDGPVAGFYTLAATSLQLDGLPAALAKKLPRYPSVPAMLIGRLAIDLRFKGQGLGRALVYDACRRTSRLGIGVYAMIVKPKTEAAAAFYATSGFLRLPGEPGLLFLPMETFARLDT